MGRTLEDFARRVHARANAQGPEAQAELAGFDYIYALANAIWQRRIALGLTQEELAARTGIPQSEISKLENGRANPTATRIGAVMSALELEPAFPARAPTTSTLRLEQRLPGLLPTSAFQPEHAQIVGASLYFHFEAKAAA